MYLQRSNVYNEDVKKVQNMLNYALRQPSFRGKWQYLVPDGYYGSLTEVAVKAFQYYHDPRIDQTGIVGDTTYAALQNVGPSISTAPPISRVPPKCRRSFLSVSGDVAEWFAKGIEYNPFVRNLVESLPKIYVNITGSSRNPSFIFNYPRGRYAEIFKRVNMSETLANHLGLYGFVVNAFAIGNRIEEFRQAKSSGDIRRYIDAGGSIIGTIIGTPEALYAAKRFFNASTQRFMLTGVSCTQTGILAALSRANLYIGTFLLGWSIGELIGNIPCGNGYTVQDYIDNGIDYIWTHPYKTLGVLGTSGLMIANLIVLWKKTIEWWVNRVQTIKPLTPEDREKLIQYIKEHPDFAIKSRYSSV
jgi:peptidoglycan hydrolase-like protein with peptidoglycan-binding domain